jgi:Tol biopolymer transport system component
MKSHVLVFTIVALAFMWVLVGYTQQTAEQLFQSGIYQEEVKGELDAAIKIYETIIKDYPDTRSVAAKALLHTGLCYEKLGKQEAQKAYQRLVNNYPDQKQEVAVASERLSRLKQLAEGAKKAEEAPLIPKFTKIKIPTELSWSVALSPDGKDLALVSNKKLWIMPLSGNLGPNIPGTPVQLNTEGLEVEWSGLSWSRDGNWIAFNENPRRDKQGKIIENQGIYLVASDGGKPKKIIENFRDVRVINYRISLSPDGKKLAFSSVKDNEQHVYTISTDGGEVRQLVDAEAREPVFSPDGKWVAYSADKDIGKFEGEQGLWVVSAEGGTPNLIADAGKASSPIWSPDGNMIAFLDYTRGKEINIIPVSKNGKANGKLTTISVPEEIEEVRLLAGWTPGNKIGALVTRKQEFGLYTLPTAGGQAAIILNNCYALQPRWSPDGKEIFFTTLPAEGSNKYWRMTLASVSSAGGSAKFFPRDPEKKYLKPFGAQGGNRISPDGKTIISAAWCTDDTLANIKYPGSHIWKISADGLEQTKLTHIDGPYVDLCPSWSPDGKEVAFVRYHLLENKMDMFGGASLLTVKSSGGNPKLIITEPEKSIVSEVWSPDGKKIAFLSRGTGVPETKTMNVVNLENGKSRILGEVPEVNFGIELAWSPDSKRIAFNDGEGKVIKVMNLVDGSIEDIETGLVGVSTYHLDWSPDGKRFVFAGCTEVDPEFWFMENFLPLEKLAQNKEAKTANEPEGISIKQVWTGSDVDDCGSVSFNGNFLSFIDWETGDVAVRNLRTNENKLITHEGTWDDPMHFAENCVISYDGNQIAYPWYTGEGKDSKFDLRVANLNNKKITNAYLAHKGEEIWPAVWYPDNKKIIAIIDNTEEAFLASINIATGETETLKRFEIKNTTNVSLSKDEKYVAFDFPDPDNNGNFDIDMISVDGKTELPLVEHPANDRLLGWLPNRNELLFVSDRSGTNDIWAVNTSNQSSMNEPKRILTNIGDIYPMGFTKDGSLYFSTRYRRFRSFISPYNVETKKLSIESRKPLLGSILDVCWLPDGESLVCYEYIQKPDNYRYHQLSIMDSKSGKKRSLAENIYAQGPPRLSPDSKSVLLFGHDKLKEGDENYKGGIYKVDITTGIPTEIRVNNYISGSHSVEWDKKGENIFYSTKNKIIKHNLVTGKEEIIFSADENFGKDFPILRRSFDGNNLLFDIEENGSEQYLKSVSVDSSKVKTICVRNTHILSLLKYKKINLSPDGKYIYFTSSVPESGSILWRVLAKGGVAEKIWQSRDRIAGLSIHPDGKQMALSVYEHETEIRVVKNLAQEVKKIYSQN